MSSGQSSSPVRVVFLGGVGEIGRNMLVFEQSGSILVCDAGLSYPNEEMLGVDLVLPDFTYVVEEAHACVGILLTHGHEDHVGALSWLLKEVDVPVYGTALTLGMAKRRLAEYGVGAELVEIEAPGRRRIGPFDCRFLAVSHSIPDAIAVALETSQGRILYTSDFKLDRTPIDGRRTDLRGLSEVAAAGVDLLLSDSTNAEAQGRTPSEAIVGDTLRTLFEQARRRIVVACFASNLHRIQQVCDAAAVTGRRVAFVGRSMLANVDVGRQLNHLKIPDEIVMEVEEIDEHEPESTVIICTGSQGEPLSALSLIASREHKWVRVEPGDTVILSASPIPGNEAAVHRVINALYRSGADVFHSETSPVHVSGHAASDELAELIRLVRPSHFVPVHGEFRHLAAHKRIAEEAGVPDERILLVEDGDVLEMTDREVRRGERVQAGTVLVDGLGVGDVGPVVLRDRSQLAQDGILVCVLALDAHTGELVAGPDLVSRGFVYQGEAQDLLDQAAGVVASALADMERDAGNNWTALKKACRRALGEFVWGATGRRPMILPVVLEV